MMNAFDGYAFRAELDVTYDHALGRTTEALKAEGFGVVTQIDMQATFREKLGVEFPRYDDWAPATRDLPTAP